MKELINQLIRQEGYRRYVYKCPTGYLTVGIGRNLEHKGISEEEAKYLLINDISDFEGEVREQLAEHLWENLNDARKNVLVNMAFNMGTVNLFKFKNMMKALKQGDWETAGKEMLNSRWAKQVGLRAQELSTQMISGKYQ